MCRTNEITLSGFKQNIVYTYIERTIEKINRIIFHSFFSFSSFSFFFSFYSSSFSFSFKVFPYIRSHQGSTNDRFLPRFFLVSSRRFTLDGRKSRFKVLPILRRSFWQAIMCTTIGSHVVSFSEGICERTSREERSQDLKKDGKVIAKGKIGNRVLRFD